MSDFADWYKKNYPTIKTEYRKFHQGSYGCAAIASTALKMYGINVRQVKLTNDVERQLKANNWTPITDMSKLQPGDVVFTGGKSNVPGTYSHVYVFGGYTDSGKRRAVSIDNYGVGTRNLYQGGDGDLKSPSVKAWRQNTPPKKEPPKETIDSSQKYTQFPSGSSQDFTTLPSFKI